MERSDSRSVSHLRGTKLEPTRRLPGSGAFKEAHGVGSPNYYEFLKDQQLFTGAGHTTAWARESIYLLSKVPGSPLMQTNWDAASLFSVVRVPCVGPDAAWNLSSLDPRWVMGSLSYLLSKRNKQPPPPPQTLTPPLSRLPFPCPPPTGSGCCRSPLLGPSEQSRADSAGTESVRSASLAEATRLIWSRNNPESTELWR